MNYLRTSLNHIIKKTGTRLLSVSIVLAMLGLSVPAQAQYDPTYTHYMFNEIYINPAYAGSKDALSIEGLTRQQWSGFPGAPKSYSLSAHTPLAKRKIGLGLGMTYQEIGTNQVTMGYFDFAYRIHFSSSVLAFGLQGSAGYHDPRYSQLKDLTDPYSNDHILQNMNTGVIFNTGFGTYYNTQNFYIGFSIPRMINNNYIDGVSDRFNVKDWTYYFQSGYVFEIYDNFSLMPSGMLKLTAGATPQLNVSLLGLAWNTLWLGADYRTDKTMALLAGLQIAKVFRFTYSYDINLDNVNRQYLGGSHEISLSYTFSFLNKRVISPRLF